MEHDCLQCSFDTGNIEVVHPDGLGVREAESGSLQKLNGISVRKDLLLHSFVSLRKLTVLLFHRIDQDVLQHFMQSLDAILMLLLIVSTLCSVALQLVTE